jgi:hypothetical protein
MLGYFGAAVFFGAAVGKGDEPFVADPLAEAVGPFL